MRVLVVEDDVMLADCLAESLVDEGHELCGVTMTVAEAVSLAHLKHPDVVVLDMQLLHGELGSDVAKLLTQSDDCAEMGFLYVTGEAERVHEEAQVGHACLKKPYRFAALSAALEIVHEIARDGRSLRSLPRGLTLLNTTDGSNRPITYGRQVAV